MQPAWMPAKCERKYRVKLMVSTRRWPINLLVSDWASCENVCGYRNNHNAAISIQRPASLPTFICLVDPNRRCREAVHCSYIYICTVNYVVQLVLLVPLLLLYFCINSNTSNLGQKWDNFSCCYRTPFGKPRPRTLSWGARRCIRHMLCTCVEHVQRGHRCSALTRRNILRILIISIC